MEPRGSNPNPGRGGEAGQGGRLDALTWLEPLDSSRHFARVLAVVCAGSVPDDLRTGEHLPTWAKI